MDKKILIRHSNNQYIEFCKLLTNSFNFTDFSLTYKRSYIKSKFGYLLDLFKDSIIIILSKKKFKEYNEFFCISWIAVPLILMTYLKLLKVKRIYWFGFFIHSPRFFIFFKYFFKTFKNVNFFLILFTKHEMELYIKRVDIDSEKLKYLPYGDWSSFYFENNSKIGEYYFTGGYSNRDYATILDVFNKNGKKLILVCSKLNKEVFKYKVNKNIKILTDISSIEFENLVKAAKACILFLKYDTGASGQSVLLSYMRNAKAIIVNNSKLILEYLDSESAFILSNPNDQLPGIIDKIECNSELLYYKGRKAYEKYQSKFSFEACKENLKKIITY